VTLRTRLTLAVAAIVAAAVFTGAFASHYYTNRELRRETDRFLVERARRFQAPGAPRGGFKVPPLVLQRGPRPLINFDAPTQLIDKNGRIVTELPGQPRLPVDAADRALAQNTGPSRLSDTHVAGQHYRVITASLPGGGAVQIARSMRETDDVLAVLQNRLIIISLLGTLLAGLVAFMLARRTMKPIRHLTDAAERVAATQDLNTPIPVRGEDEVGRLASSFNSMLAALGTSREQQKRLVADASHELRSPLTAIRTNIEFLQRAQSLDQDQRQALLSETRLELDELTTLFSELVELATDARSDEPVATVELAEVAVDVTARYRRRTGRTITLSMTDPATVEGRRTMLERALSNFIDNACKFSDPSTPVDVNVRGAALEVADRGPGVPPDERARVFDRFYRTIAARSHPGSGLGLSIVRQIADVHGGVVSLLPRPGGGTIARLDLGDAKAPPHLTVVSPFENEGVRHSA
jgi:two-component system, OmpR family, sensor histidine kinase MprB